MEIKQYDIWLVNLNPSKGTEPGKIRPVVIIQTDLLNDFHPSTLICPITSKVLREVKYLRVHLSSTQMDKLSDVLVDQIRAIDNQRFIKRLGKLTKTQQLKLKQNLAIVLDL
jgi:mRNA interferase MazF